MLRQFCTATAVCFALSLASPALADDDDPESPQDDKKEEWYMPDAREAVKRADFVSAIEFLERTTAHHPDAVQAWNLLGYSQRKLGQFAKAHVSYGKALTIDPEHKLTLEYLGELYVQTSETTKAEATLAKLEALCPSGCKEVDKLKAFMAGTSTASGYVTR